MLKICKKAMMVLNRRRRFFTLDDYFFIYLNIKAFSYIWLLLCLSMLIAISSQY